MGKKRILFLNRFYWPDESATAQILTDLAGHLAAEGHCVTILTSRLRYEKSSQSKLLPSSEQHAGVQILRLWSTSFGRDNLIGRLIDYLSIYWSFFIYLISKTTSSDIVVVKTDPPLLSILGWVARMLKHFKLVSWCQDLFPEVAESALGGSGLTKPCFSILRQLRNASLNQCDMVAVLSGDMKSYLEGQGIHALMKILPNWAIQSSAHPDVTHNDLRRDWGLSDKLVLGYSGNLGRAHDIETFVEASNKFPEMQDLSLLFIGAGAGLKSIQKRLSPATLQQAKFMPYQPKEMLAASLKVPDIHWLSLSTEMTDYVFPSKFYGILRSGRPVIFIGATNSELANLINDNDCGFVVEPGDWQGLLQCVKELYEQKDRRLQLAANASKLNDSRTNRDLSLKQWNLALCASRSLNDL